MIRVATIHDGTAGIRERAKAGRRQRIYDAVLAILREQGLPALSTARIAARAGVSVATLYNLIGGVERILDLLVERLFDGLETALSEPVDVGGPAPAFEGYVESAYRYLAAREDSLRAAQRAIFQRSLASGASNPVIAVAAQSIDRLAGEVRALQRAGSIAVDADPRLLAQQMIVCQSMLLENWSVGLVELGHFRLATRYQFLMLLRAWATAASAAEFDRALRERQRELATLLRRPRSPRRNGAKTT